MRNFHNLVYATTGIGDDTEGLKQALSLARNNQAALKIVLVYPEVPKNLEVYRETFEASLLNQVESAVETVRVALKMNEAEVSVRVEVKSGDIPFAIDIIRHVLREAHDLLIKEADPKEGGKGFSSTDMTLLRKCPCAVWLARPIVRSRKEMRVAVAISPESREEAESALSIRLLRLARSLSDTCSGELDIICCSDYAFEQYLRRNSRVRIPEETMLSAMQQVQTQHQASLGRLIQSSGIGGTYHIRYLRGQAEKAIPNFIQINAVDLLVMGTVARSGIAGFFLGNTAENIMAELGCSLLALKPSGFVSPVKAY
jgi:nucleotide-binding universal stress UspA family protein